MNRLGLKTRVLLLKPIKHHRPSFQMLSGPVNEVFSVCLAQTENGRTVHYSVGWMGGGVLYKPDRYLATEKQLLMIKSLARPQNSYVFTTQLNVYPNRVCAWNCFTYLKHDATHYLDHHHDWKARHCRSATWQLISIFARCTHLESTWFGIRVCKCLKNLRPNLDWNKETEGKKTKTIVEWITKS